MPPQRCSSESQEVNLKTALLTVIRNPWNTFVRRWNWKAALLSSLFRGGIFFTVNLSAGWEAAVGALLAEFVFRACTTGFYGALTQSFRKVEPAWKGAAAAMLILPVFQHTLELFVHWLRGTPELAASILASATFTAFSTLFNLYAMRQGALIVGQDQRTLLEDMKAIPAVAAGFLMSGVMVLWRGLSLARGGSQ